MSKAMAKSIFSQFLSGGTLPPEGSETLNCTDSLGRTETGLGEMMRFVACSVTLAVATVRGSSTLVARTLMVAPVPLSAGAVKSPVEEMAPAPLGWTDHVTAVLGEPAPVTLAVNC